MMGFSIEHHDIDMALIFGYLIVGIRGPPCWILGSGIWIPGRGKT